MKLIRDVKENWNGYGTKLWAERELAKIQDDEQLRIIEDV